MTGQIAVAAEVSEAEQAILGRYVSDVDWASVPQSAADHALALHYSRMGSDKDGAIEMLLTMDMSQMPEFGTATGAQMALIQRYAPDLNVDALTSSQVQSALAIIYGGDGRSQISGELANLFQ